MTTVLLICAMVGAGCSHTASTRRSQTGRASVVIERPENNGSVNILPCTIILSDGQRCTLIGGEHAIISVQSGALCATASSADPYVPPNSGYPVAWHSPRFGFHLGAGERVRLSVEPRSSGSTYIGGWTISRAANEVTSADGGWRVPFAFVAQWPAAAEFIRWAFQDESVEIV
jgi:hypothetical protein